MAPSKSEETRPRQLKGKPRKAANRKATAQLPSKPARKRVGSNSANDNPNLTSPAVATCEISDLEEEQSDAAASDDRTNDRDGDNETLHVNLDSLYTYLSDDAESESDKKGRSSWLYGR
jgi:hypothetical protein